MQLNEKRLDAIEKDLKGIKTEVEELKNNLGSRLDNLTTVIEQQTKSVTKMNFGLYGDPENDQIGLIQRNRSIIDEVAALRQDHYREVKELKKEIAELKKKNSDQDLAIGVKAKTNSLWFTVGRKLVEFVLQGAIYYLIFKGVLAPDLAKK